MRNSLTSKFSPGDKYIQTLFHLGQLISLSLLARKPEELWQHEFLRLQEVHEEKKDKCTKVPHYTRQTAKTSTGGCRADFKLARGISWQNTLPANTLERKHTQPGDSKWFVRRTQPTECKCDTSYLSRLHPFSVYRLTGFLCVSALWKLLSAAHIVMEAVLEWHRGLTTEVIVPSVWGCTLLSFWLPPSQSREGGVKLRLNGRHLQSLAPTDTAAHTHLASTSLLNPLQPS